MSPVGAAPPRRPSSVRPSLRRRRAHDERAVARRPCSGHRRREMPTRPEPFGLGRAPAGRTASGLKEVHGLLNQGDASGRHAPDGECPDARSLILFESQFHLPRGAYWQAHGPAHPRVAKPEGSRVTTRVRTNLATAKREFGGAGKLEIIVRRWHAPGAPTAVGPTRSQPPRFDRAYLWHT